MGAKREKGKIPRGEWPAIIARSSEGESLASIARHYNCTAPAIRYIVKRGASPNQKQDGRRNAVVGARQPGEGERRAAPKLGAVGRASRPSLDADIYDRVTSDIASFLVVLDVAVVEPSRGNLASLRVATDRLMRAAARTRLELERVLASPQGDAASTIERTAAERH